MMEKSSLQFQANRALLFARNFFKFPTMLGSIVPSSSFLINDVLGQVEWERAKVIVEYGPGVGTITQEILKRMRSEATLIVIELNPDFANFLREEIKDPRLRVVQDSATNVRKVLTGLGVSQADCIVSGIPFSTMSHSMRKSVLEESRQLLTPKGVLLMYQFTGTVLPYLRSSFGSVQQKFQLLNVLPARIFYCTP